MLAEIQEAQKHVPAEQAAGSISLIDLAEILDQHKQWVESGGETGIKADLCGVNLSHSDLTGVNLEGAFLQRACLTGADLAMANLRGASLVQADLRDSNLLGTELRGANLMGANLYGAEGLWVGRLGGTNLFDAILPETIAAFDTTKAIADATKVARWFYFLILASCLACIALIGMTTDVRLIMDASAIPIARFPKIISMTSFYMGAPLVLFILYLRFHFLLLRLWGSMSGLPAVFRDGQTLEKDGPWYLMGLVRRHFRWMREGRSPFWVLETVIATALAYWVVPATLFLFWLRYLVRQDFRGTLLHAFLLTLCVAAATCVPTIVARVLQPGDLLRQKSKNLLRLGFATARAALLTGCALLLFSLGINQGLPSDKNIAPQYSPENFLRWTSEALQSIGYRPYAELTEAALSGPVPRGNWNDEALDAIPGAKLNEMNLRFARAYRVFLVNARLWRVNFDGAYLSEGDLRGANLREAILKDAILDRVRAAKSVMVSADATRANFTGADLRGADLSFARMENGILSNARLGGATLYAVDLKNGQLLRSDLTRADMRDTRMENAVLSFATLEQTDFSSARLNGGNLTGASFKGTILMDTDLENADLRGASFPGAVMRGTRTAGATVGGADFRGALGLTAEQVCAMKGWQGAQFDADVLAQTQALCGARR
ncbi:MAG TPA: pentapeptide repeat-containing protein [Candidatus Acidoferrum sp.]|nr:pentapeptide repeat-containing protein [Candidatus Acidoferrum sp.]